MKKKIRSIVVDNVNYNWVVVENDFPSATLRVWRQGEKNTLFIECSILINEPVKPSDIAKYISCNASQMAVNRNEYQAYLIVCRKS